MKSWWIYRSLSRNIYDEHAVKVVVMIYAYLFHTFMQWKLIQVLEPYFIELVMGYVQLPLYIPSCWFVFLSHQTMYTYYFDHISLLDMERLSADVNKVR